MNRRIAFIPLLACGLVLAIACSSSDDNAPPAVTGPGGDAASTADGSSGGDGSTMGMDSASGQDGATGDAADAADEANTDSGLVCGAVTNTAPAINDTTSVSTVPVGTGGAIVDGVYFLTAIVDYLTSTVTPKSHTFTANIVGTSFGLEGHDASNPTAAAGFTITSTIGGTISFVGNCPADNVGKGFGAFDSYTVATVGSTTTLTLYSSTNKNSATFTKQ